MAILQRRSALVVCSLVQPDCKVLRLQQPSLAAHALGGHPSPAAHALGRHPSHAAHALGRHGGIHPSPVAHANGKDTLEELSAHDDVL